MSSLLHTYTLRWYDDHQRDLPWRRSSDPYTVWLSEILLQQTQVRQGLPYFKAFIDAYPSVCDLADASQDDIFKLWEGLGYYRRAEYLYRCAHIVCHSFDGQFPNTYDGLLDLPGIGPYTAAAIASICFGVPRAVVDGNVVRVLGRVFRIDDVFSSTRATTIYHTLAQHHLSEERPGDSNQALMELGATICRPRKPTCHRCPLIHQCQAYSHGETDQYPKKKRRQKVINRSFHYVLFQSDSGLLIRQRDAKDIWHGLYELPYIEQRSRPTKKQWSTWANRHHLLWDGATTLMTSRQQLLSHQHITAYIYRPTSQWDYEGTSDNQWTRIHPSEIANFAYPRILNWFYDELGLS